MGASSYKANGNFATELEEELMKFTTNHEGVKMEVEQIEKVPENASMEVDITEYTKSGGNNQVEAECQDTTESSSSFDDSDSGVENGGTLDGSEAMSNSHGDGESEMDFDAWFGEIGRTRNKKVTSHWRSYIQPFMWRCKWAELKIKKLEDQADEYHKKLEKCNQQKQVQLEGSTLESLGAKSIPFFRDYPRSNVLQRKKRRRNEATTDIAAYMSRHNLFSYYGNKKCSTESALLNDGPENSEVESDDEFGCNNELLRLETGNDDSFLEDIFRKIGFLQSQVGKMKSRVHKLTSENAGKLSCSNNSSLSMPSNGLMGSCQTNGLMGSCQTNGLMGSCQNNGLMGSCQNNGLVGSFENNGDEIPLGNYIASQLILEYNSGNNILVPQRAITSHGEAVADVNGSTNHVYFAGAYGNEEEEDVLIDNLRANEEMKSFEEMKVQPIIQIQKPPLVPNNGRITSAPRVPIEPDHQRPLKIRSISKITAPRSKTTNGRTEGAGW